MFRDARALGKCLGHLKLLPNVNSPDTSQTADVEAFAASAASMVPGVAKIAPREISHQFRYQLVSTFRPAVFDCDTLAFNGAGFT
jgi:hypothetical protein